MIKRVTEILYEMAAKEGFYFLDIERFCKKNKQEIQNLNTVFDANNDSRNDEIMDVAHYLISKTFDNFGDYEKPENFDDDKKLVLAGFIENQSFFSMCWNYMVLEKHKVKIVPKKKEENNSFVYSFEKYKDIWKAQIDYRYYADSAGTPGFNNLTRIVINNLGSLRIMGNEETKRLFFVVSLDEELKNKKFEILIKFEINGEEKQVSILKDYEDKEDDISSDPINVDFSKGFRIIDIVYKSL